ncbi:MAG: 2-oxoglutarate dehydrogenase complex dihydrolipoyllysine-residue succinyltransferase [SAR324 cluster bacterium]|nr:2-oxoglutarate dehydrogenase complex dihydrolipoyllysine-residue succinyltransferase [SAR324 cluster bacterium]
MNVEVKIPSPGESITEVEIAGWMKQDGDYVEVDDVLCEIETDKATLPLHAEVSGVLQIVLPEGTEASVGDVVCSIDTSTSPKETASSAKPVDTLPTETTPTAASEKESAKVDSTYATGVPSVAAAKIMAEKQIPAKAIEGTGKGGRITKADVLEQAQKAPTPTMPPSEKPAPVADSTPAGERGMHREKMSKLRKKLSERLVAVKNETAMLTTFNEVNMHALMELRKKYKERFLDKYGIKLGFMSFFTKACAEALRDFPAVNGMIDGEEIVYHDYVDVGIAVSAPKGLVVPVVRNAQLLTIAEIEAEIMRLASKARENKLALEEMTGGTFSITNGGVFGSMLSTPIINPPQSAILGMHNVVERPLAINGQVEIRPVMYVALSYDHRIIDGRESVSFLYKVKEYLEDPARLLLGV